MTSPARNAPRASDAPAAAVPRAVSVPTRMTAMRNNSRLRVLRISARTRGTTVRASTSTLITTSTALPSARNSAPPPPPDRPARNGRTSIKGTTHKSWNISTPVARRPWGASISPLSVSPLRTMAVLESATRKPRSSDTRQLRCSAMASTQLSATVRPTWAPPPATTCRPISRSRLRENSMPMVKSNRMTPTSARLSTWCASETKPSALGPSKTPATMNPGRAGSLIRWNTRMTSRETAKMIAKSLRAWYSLMAARVLEVPFASVLELRPESRTLLLRAGVGWRDGAVGRTVLPTDADSHAGYVLRSTGPVVVEDLATDARFGSAPLLAAQGVVSSLSVLVHGKGRPFGILGVHTAQPREFTIHDTHFLQAVANVLATAIDRAHAEEALRRSEEHFRSRIENASDIVTIVGENGVFRYASPSVERVLGYAPRDLLERNAFDYVHPEDIAIVAEALAGAIRHPGVPQAAQFRFRAQDGAWRLLEAVGQARVDPGGSAQLIVNARDVTERRRQERALRENKERPRTVIAGAPLLLFALDRGAGFTMVEGRGLDAVGGRPALVLGHSAFQLFAELPHALAGVRPG